MNKIRMKFTKGEQVKYISHLDLMRTFYRAFRRAGLSVAYSQGFNPHPVVSFALPLAVGATSEAEYMDVELEKDLESNVIINKLNHVLPEGIKVIEIRKQSEDEMRSFNDIAFADYVVKAELNVVLPHIEKHIENILKENEIMVEKQGKKGVKLVNIRDDIHELSIIERYDKTIVLKMKLSAGNESNLKPDLVLRAFDKYIEGFVVDHIQVHRTAQYFKDGSDIMGV